MAETVQFYLEQMVPELEDLERKELFSNAEIKNIVKKRTHFEYALKRRPTRKIDFVNYIEYEKDLEQQRRKRKQRFGIKGKISLSDYSLTRRIFNLYNRAITKFHGDIELWLQYIEFAKSVGATKLIGKIFGSAVQTHPTKPIFWILAAKWEFEENANISASRVLMQRGLRFNPETIQFWHEYFKLELMYIEKIKKRRRILGISSNILSEDENSDMHLDKDQINSLKEDNNRVLQGDISIVIFFNAIKSHIYLDIPNNLSFRQQFINITREFTDVEKIQNEIYSSIDKDFGNDPQAQTYIAERHVSDILEIDDSVEFMSAIEKSINDFDKYIQTSKNKEIVYLYTQFMRKYIDKVSKLPNIHVYLTDKLIEIYKFANESNLASEKLYIDWIDWMLLPESRKEPELKQIAKRSTDIYPNCAELWNRRIRINDNISFEEGNQDFSTEKLYEISMEKNPISSVLWDSYLNWIHNSWKNRNISDNDMENLLMSSTLKISSMPFVIGGIEKVRALYKR
ncbi:3936_t:CDS:10 [Entrophospora sp. SA101]|nr:3936_t:CDS:10 [Entrophospora sp. SA101]